MTAISNKSGKVITEKKRSIWTPGQIVLMIVILIFSLRGLLFSFDFSFNSCFHCFYNYYGKK